jgi:hypothetical protein
MSQILLARVTDSPSSPQHTQTLPLLHVSFATASDTDILCDDPSVFVMECGLGKRVGVSSYCCNWLCSLYRGSLGLKTGIMFVRLSQV